MGITRHNAELKMAKINAINRAIQIKINQLV